MEQQIRFTQDDAMVNGGLNAEEKSASSAVSASSGASGEACAFS
jgi:hypothetical protein